MKNIFILLLCIGSLLIFKFSVEAQQSGYTIRELTPAPGLAPETLVSTITINDRGQIAGTISSADYNSSQPFFIADSAQPGVLLTRPPSSMSTFARDINNSGVIVGGSGETSTSSRTAVYWSTPTAAPAVLNIPNCIGERINNHGQALVQCQTPTINSYVWDVNSGSLTILPEANYEGINDAGQLISFAGNGYTAAIGSPGAFRQIFAQSNSFFGAYAMNNKNQVYVSGGNNGLGSGIYDDRTGEFFSILFSSSTYFFNLNDNGVTVGFGAGTSYIVDKINGQRNLDTLLPANSGWSRLQPNDINNRGEIVGNGLFNGTERPFLIRPEACVCSCPPLPTLP